MLRFAVEFAAAEQQQLGNLKTKLYESFLYDM